MTPRQIIAAAWAITRREKSLRRWGYVSAFFETLLSLKMIIYQLYFFYTYVLVGDTIGFFEIEEILYRHLPFGVFLGLVIAFIILLIVEVFIPSLCLGAIIGLAAKAHRKEETKGGLVLGLYNFFPLFVLKEILVLSSVSMAVTFTSLIIRYGGGELMVTFLLGALWFMWGFSNLLRFLLSFAEESAVIRKTGVFESMGRSFKLVISHLGQIVFLLMLLFVISLRILLNAVMVLLLPALIVGMGFLLLQFLPAGIAYAVTAALGLALVIGASYLFAYLEVFKQTVWTVTFLELNALKDLDVIES